MGIRHNDLLDWVKTATDEQVIATGTSRGYLRQIGYGNKAASAATAARIEVATNRLVTRQELRPNDWMVVWPELAAA
ncbi:hypothetical protein HG264_04215 [Pseudomonas sp. gcc21]|uniref:hypothetical protein n=1 Tax=Pseudomonas sp. gcc21 TaxID=2726989 RepID=UPI00145186A4|nr:hypothetical protein [Pseudomonas sp. gcc21]QJD58176.1 hypothetical protein HG264_04215 [Pseudomonas sp. gcc21]